MVVLVISSPCQSPATLPGFGNRSAFSVLGGYSNDSSHILIGRSEQRKSLSFGGAYSRKVFATRLFDFQYLAEMRPVIVEGDPVTHSTAVYTFPQPATTTSVYVPTFACHTGSTNYTFTDQGTSYVYTITDSCSRRWTWGAGLSPIGIKVNFFRYRRLQPIFTSLGGCLFSSRAIPIPQASSANFTFEVGAGLELYYSTTRSIQAEYRYHHISNAYLATTNPGIDSGVLQISYSFGR